MKPSRTLRRGIGLSVLLACASLAHAHVTYNDITGLSAGLTVSNFTNYGWANGTRVNGVGTATTSLGDSHFLQVGPTYPGSTSNSVAIFKFTAAAATETITATDKSTSTTDYADPAIALYRGYDPANPILLNGSHDGPSSPADDPQTPLATLTNPAETGSTWPFDGLRIAGSTIYDGQFSAFSDFSMASGGTGTTRRGLVWIASSNARTYRDGNAAHNRPVMNSTTCSGTNTDSGGHSYTVSGTCQWGKTETLTVSGLTVGQIYTIIVSGERCIAKTKQPYAALGGGTCNSGTWNVNGRYSINVKVAP